MMSFFYLHGWASSPQSSKALFFKQRFAELGYFLNTPDLNQPNFYHLTLSRQLQQVGQLLPKTPCTLIGSSLGGLTALWLAKQYPQIERLVLLAPALDFPTQCQRIIGAENLHQWKTMGEMPIFHYAWEKEIPLSYTFISDCLNYPDALLQRQLPSLILHGQHDETIPVQTSRHFVQQRPWIQLIELESDHSLMNKLDIIWQEIQTFCQLSPHQNQ
ncbi:YqiA/YcfP family alpha/beta fold hydrolase [Beggiatoa leptomitoformis]|uniref:Alpha/beta fold hydrolase n=1 Tax=Beggiatoa leptomitoformis TaxID=288004 RepID=A0A2N9YFY1_9GAMM|nr:YqiA/YcfP family alpha/beta fold hydrolase [Beggiatoa leptomitoformis]ALG68224.1 alpha/beta fold hydrolase [Beggiatoa leptomitoformis]AUI69471.1 alpha/beta fold hydrolase [Beggiatoa leptomitoformis]